MPIKSVVPSVGVPFEDGVTVPLNKGDRHGS